MTDVTVAVNRDGYAIIPDVLHGAAIDAIEAALAATNLVRPGSRRMLDAPWCRDLAASLVDHPSLSALLMEAPVPVQCTLFDKSDDRNWLVAIHQDLAVPVHARVEHPALGAWSRKERGNFVIAPPELLARMLAVRLHLDNCGAGNGPLRVVPGSHRHGRLGRSDIDRLRADVAEVDCLVGRRGALVLRPLLLHASSRASADGRRRVLHFLFGPCEPGYGLAWPETPRHRRSSNGNPTP